MLAHSIGYDACTGTLRHAPDQGIVGIEDGCPFRWQAFHKLAFLESRSLASPECGVVVVANRRHHADLRAQQPKRLRQGSWTPRSDLANAEPRLWTHLPEHVAQSAWNPSRAVLQEPALCRIAAARFRVVVLPQLPVMATKAT